MLNISENHRKRSANCKAEKYKAVLSRERKLFDSTETLMQTMFLLLLFDLEKYAELGVFLVFLLLNLLLVLIFYKI